MALVADRLPLIGADLNSTGALKQRWYRKLPGPKVHLLASIKERERRRYTGCGRGNSLGRLALRRTLAMQLMACHAWHRRLVLKRSASQVPRPGSIHRL